MERFRSILFLLIKRRRLKIDSLSGILLVHCVYLRKNQVAVDWEDIGERKREESFYREKYS